MGYSFYYIWRVRFCMDDFSTIGLALISVVFGYLISMWQDWFRPWIRLVSLSDDNYAGSLEIELPQNIVDLTKKSRMAYNTKRNVELGDISRTVYENEDIHELYAAGRSIIDSILERIHNCQSDAELITILEKFLDNKVLREDLLTVVDMNKIFIPAIDETTPSKLKYYLDTDEKSFAVDFDEKVIFLGAELTTRQAKKEKIEKLLKVFGSLNREKLIEIFNVFIPLWYEQYDVNPKIIDYFKEILRQNSSWGITFYVSNYGNKPFILIPEETKMILNSKDHKIPPFDLVLLKWEENDEDAGWIRVKTDLLISEGKSEYLKVVTKQTQIEMSEGEIIRAIYSTGNSYVYVNLSIIEPNFSWKFVKSSNAIKFSTTE